jgi:MFS family permease
MLDNLTQQYRWIYTRILGADALQIGYISSLSGVVSAIISVPAGWSADIQDLKKVIIFTQILNLSIPLIYAIAWNWQMVIPAVVLSSAVTHLMWSNVNISIANSTTDEERGSGFALIQSFSQVSAIFSPLIAGYVIQAQSGINTQSIRPLFYAQFIGSCMLCFYVFKKFKNPSSLRMTSRRSFISDIKDIFKDNTNLKRFIIVRCLMSFINSLVGAFTMVFASEIKGASVLTIGAMVTAQMIVAAVVAIPLGRFSDRFGRKPTIYLQEVSLCIQYFLLILAPMGKPEYLITAWVIGGISMGGMGWSTIIMEMVPADQRGRWGGISQLFNGVALIPGSILGGLLWDRFNPESPFIAYICITVFILMPIFTTIPETLRRKKIVRTSL